MKLRFFNSILDFYASNFGHKITIYVTYRLGSIRRSRHRLRSKHARISEEPAEVHEVGNSNKIPEAGAMTDGSKRRHEAVEEAGTEETETEDESFSYISESGNSPPIFPIFPSGLPQTFRWSDDWKTINID